VDLFALRPQIQEFLTGEIADALMQVLRPRAVLVLLEATHDCLSFRGAKKPGHKTVTHALRGHMAADLKDEFLSLVRM
jgi:GTP cyclohydrolase I